MHYTDPIFPDVIDALASGDRVRVKFCRGSFRLSGAEVLTEAGRSGWCDYADDDRSLRVANEFLRYADGEPGRLIEAVLEVNGMAPAKFLSRRRAEQRGHENGYESLVVDLGWLLGPNQKEALVRLGATAQILRANGNYPTARDVIERLVEAINDHNDEG